MFKRCIGLCFILQSLRQVIELIFEINLRLVLARSTFICVHARARAKIFDLLVVVGFHAFGSTLRLFRVKHEFIPEVVKLRNKVCIFVLKTLQL